MPQGHLGFFRNQCCVQLQFEAFVKNSVLYFSVLADIWSGQRQGVLWSKIGPYKIFSADLQNLAPGKEVESEVNACCLKPFH